MSLKIFHLFPLGCRSGLGLVVSVIMLGGLAAACAEAPTLPTPTPIQPTSAAQVTAVVPTAADATANVPLTATAAPTNTRSMTGTPTLIKLPSATATATRTETKTATPTGTATATATSTQTPVVTATHTPAPLSTTTAPNGEVNEKMEAAQALLQASSNWLTLLTDGFGEFEGFGWGTGEGASNGFDYKLSIAEGKYHWEISATSDMAFNGRPAALFGSLSNYVVSVDGHQLSGTPNCRYGIILRLVQGGLYVFDIADDQSFVFLKGGQVGGEQLLVGTHPAIKPHAPNRITAIAQDSQFTFFVNGQYVGQVEDASFTNGNAAIVVRCAKAGDTAVIDFDNFELRVP